MMKPSINKEKGFSIVEIDNDCEYDMFYKVANIIESDFSCKFHNKVEGLDSLYWSFEYEDYNFTLYYNIYSGIEIYPTNGSESNPEENKVAEKFSEKVFKILILSDWNNFDEGKTISTKGKSDELIIWDKEHPDGARLTIVQGEITFATIVHVYGLILKRISANTKEESEDHISKAAFQINKLFEHENIEDSRKDKIWEEKCNRMIAELVG